MSNMLSTVIHDDFVWSAIASVLTGSRRGSNGAQMVNCPMCVLRGETPDKRHRLGITRQVTGVICHCFNCDFRSEFKVGETLTKNMRNLLERLGVPSRDVQRINHKALQYRRMISSSPEAQAVIPVSHNPSFPSVVLPEGAFKLGDWVDHGIEEQDFFDVAEYLFSRGPAVSEVGDYYWTPNKENDFNRRLIIPFTHNDQVVGYTGRLIDKSTPDNPKYWNRSPSNYLYNNEVMELDRRFLIVVEGPMDAKAMDGVSPLGAKLSEEQVRWLNTCGKQIIVLADRDRSGQRLIDHAVTNNWMVSFPKLRDGHGMQNWWDDEVKDGAEAALNYGKLYAIRSVIASATSNKIEIGVKRKLLY